MPNAVIASRLLDGVAIFLFFCHSRMVLAGIQFPVHRWRGIKGVEVIYYFTETLFFFSAPAPP